MGVKNSHTTSDYLNWDVATNLIRKLYKDGDYRMSVFIGAGIFFGLRVSDIRQLTWAMLLDDERFILTEQKTGKRREVLINKDFQKHVQKCFDALQIENKEEPFLVSQKRMVFSTQRLNVKLKEIKKKYKLKIDNFSCHSLRKAFGRRIFEQSGENAQLALVKLSELFNHSNVAVTKVYLGLRQQEILESYSLLQF